MPEDLPIVESIKKIEKKQKLLDSKKERTDEQTE